MLKARVATKKFADVLSPYLSGGTTVLLAEHVVPLAKCKEVSTSRSNLRPEPICDPVGDRFATPLVVKAFLLFCDKLPCSS